MSRTLLIHIKLEPELKDFLRETAKEQARSMNAQIAFMLQQEMKKKEASNPAVGSRFDASPNTKPDSFDTIGKGQGHA